MKYEDFCNAPIKMLQDVVEFLGIKLSSKKLQVLAAQVQQSQQIPKMGQLERVANYLIQRFHLWLSKWGMNCEMHQDSCF